MPRHPTKAQLVEQVQELTEKLREAEAKLARGGTPDRESAERLEAERDKARKQAEEAELKLREVDEATRALESEKRHVVAERDSLRDQLAAEQEHVLVLQSDLEGAHDEADRSEWELERAQRDLELAIARAKDCIRAEHAKELDTRDELISLLKEKVRRLLQESEKADSSDETGESKLGSGSPQVESPPKDLGLEGDRTRRMTLPRVPMFTGEEKTGDEETFEKWVRKLERHAELERWSEREKLVQLELHLSGRAERLFDLLPPEVKAKFTSTVESLRKRLAPVRREALLSAQLMKTRQKPTDSVDEYAQHFESLFDQSYGRRSGMDQDSKDLLKRDLFVQGLKLHWQEKVLPSAETFADALHQARAAEEQDRQLGEMHPTRGGLPRPEGQPDKVQRRGEPPAGVRERDTLAPLKPKYGKVFSVREHPTQSEGLSPVEATRRSPWLRWQQGRHEFGSFGYTSGI